MAKCPMCNAKKGKRVCKLVENQKVCSLCCGTTRDENCVGCEHYKSPLESRKYSSVPKYSTKEMEMNMDLNISSNNIELCLCDLDTKYDNKLQDEVAIDIYKLLMDKYYFKDRELLFQSNLIKEGFESLDRAVKTDSLGIDKLIKIIGVLYFVANRRTRGGREYFKIIYDYVGEGSRVRMIG